MHVALRGGEDGRADGDDGSVGRQRADKGHDRREHEAALGRLPVLGLEVDLEDPQQLEHSLELSAHAG